MIPKVSVIVPVYNVELYLKECVESIRQQTLQDIEIILVDDKSPDRSPLICDEYAQLDKRIKVIHKPINEGLGFARNSGLEVASGEFVAFLDSDDFIEKNMYQTLYERAHREACDIVFCSTSFYTDHTIKPKKEVDNELLVSTAKEKKDFLLDFIAPEPRYKSDVKYMMSVWKAIYRRDIIEKKQIRFMSERKILSEDIFFNLTMITQSKKILFIPYFLHYYRKNNNSLSHSFSIKKYLTNRAFFSELKNFLDTFLKEDEYINRLYRLQFLHLRIFLLSSLKNPPQTVALSQAYDIINDPLWQPLLNNYPFQKLPLKHKLFFKLIKNKRIKLLYLISTKIH